MLNPNQFGEWKSLDSANPAAYQMALALRHRPSSDVTSPNLRGGLVGGKGMFGRKKPPAQRLVKYNPTQPSAN